MLKNIKSSYFIQIFFSYVNEEQKLKIIKYNKSLQKNLYISIINYKHFSGKYIIYGSNGIGKEYQGYDDSLIFEGEYSNGERNGKGKEYDDKGKLEFEGEYINGKRNGKGKEYDYYGTLRFEGEYFNNKKWIGTMYDSKGNIIKKLNNNINGKGKEYNLSGDIMFEGEYLNGKRNGKGIEYHNDISSTRFLVFEGEYLNDLKWNGNGYDSLDNIVYELKDGNGFIKEYFCLDGVLSFEGEYINGNKNRKGKEYDWNGRLIFEGEYLNGKRHGKGKEFYDNGELRFEGEYLYGYKLKGKFYINEKLEYEGEYLYNKKWNGKGYDENGNIIYELINGNGKVKEYYSGGYLKFEGEYLNGKRNGKGKEYNLFTGELEYEGEYRKGIKIKNEKE